MQQQTVQIIDENNPIDVQTAAAAESSMVVRPDSILFEENSRRKEPEQNAKKSGTKASKLPKFVRGRRGGEQKSRQQQEGQAVQQQSAPKSPLMSVAHSVKVF